MEKSSKALAEAKDVVENAKANFLCPNGLQFPVPVVYEMIKEIVRAERISLETDSDKRGAHTHRNLRSTATGSRPIASPEHKAQSLINQETKRLVRAG